MAIKLKFFLCFALVLGGTFILPNCNAGIIYPPAPSGGEQAVSSALDSKFLKPFTHLPSAKDLTIAKPFGVYWYVINDTNLLSGGFLSAIKFAGWRFLLTDRTNSAALQLCYHEKKQEWPTMGWIFYGACPNSSDPVLQTLRAAENLPQVKKHDYELRYLDFMPLQFCAIWLHGKSSDIIIPVPMYGKWQDFRPYSEGEISGILKRKIEEELKQPPYKGPGIPVD